MIDSMVDVVASLIAHVLKPQTRHEEHQIALVQSFWIFAGGFLVLLEALRHMDESVEMAAVGIAILVLTVVVDMTIIRQLQHDKNPVVIGLKEDIKADVTNSLGGLVALTVIAFGAPMIVDKVVAIVISVYLIFKGLHMFHENMIAASEAHEDHHDETPEIEREGFPFPGA
jgi:divalent metal cation (Fe/Co/Zn/Cd) transporter